MVQKAHAIIRGALINLSEKIRDIPDFPRQGIIFKDITTLLKDADALRYAIDQMAEHYSEQAIDLVVGIESRGFILGTPLAYLLGTGFVPVRKLGKLPAKSVSVEYALEYGNATLEIHEDAVSRGQRVLICDDLLATGGTARATIDLVTRLGGQVVSLAFLVELTFLHGRRHLGAYDVLSLITY